MKRMVEHGTLAALLGTCVVAAACSSSQGATLATPTPAPAVTTSAAAVERARADSVTRPYTEADVAFMTMMISHHAQAVTVSRWAASHGAGAAVQRLADRIVNGQEDEIRIMQQWLLDRQRPVPGLHAHAHAHEPGMHGMLTEAQLKQLDAARGAEFDRLFLTFMIQHHKGAVQMARDLFASHGAAQDQTVFKFANDVQVDQTTEIARMEQMLASMTTTQRDQ